MTHCNPPCLGSDFSHYLSFRAASAPPSPVKCVCMCQHMVTATQRESRRPRVLRLHPSFITFLSHRLWPPPLSPTAMLASWLPLECRFPGSGGANKYTRVFLLLCGTLCVWDGVLLEGKELVQPVPLPTDSSEAWCFIGPSRQLEREISQPWRSSPLLVTSLQASLMLRVLAWCTTQPGVDAWTACSSWWASLGWVLIPGPRTRPHQHMMLQLLATSGSCSGLCKKEAATLR